MAAWPEFKVARRTRAPVARSERRNNTTSFSSSSMSRTGTNRPSVTRDAQHGVCRPYCATGVNNPIRGKKNKLIGLFARHKSRIDPGGTFDFGPAVQRHPVV